MHICQFTFEYYPVIGGIAEVVKKLSDRLALSGHEITVATPDFFPARSIDSPHHLVYFPRPPGNLMTPAWEKQVWEFLAQKLTGVDLIHAHSAMPCGYLCSRRTVMKQIPMVITCHGGDLFHLPEMGYGYSPKYRDSVQQAFNEAFHITTPSRFLKSLALHKGAASRKTTVIPHGVDMLSDNNYTEDKPYLLYLGGLRPIKGVDLLLKAFSKMVEKNRELRLYIVGKGNIRKDLVKLSLLLNLSRKVNFKDPVKGREKEGLLRGCRLVMVPSRMESFGITALEAQAAGKPVVAFDVGGISENVVNRKTGILVPAGDIAGMAEQTLKLLEDKERYRKYSANARKRAEIFSWESAAEKYLEIYESAVRGKL